MKTQTKKKLEDYRAGGYKQQFEYKSFSPSPINLEWSWEDAGLNVLLEKASRVLSELNAYTMIVPNVDQFIYMHIAKEANTSSKIEGTKTEIDEVMLPESAVLSENKDDWKEVHNYIEAMRVAISKLNQFPLSMRLIKDIHRILLSGVRGKNKNPGEIRWSQNWIGGNSLKDAHFIPPHWEEVPDLLSDLEMFWHNENIYVPHLIKCAISHYQFETIHPFCDGNGRIGRLLIPLYLISFGIMQKPSLYMSAYFERDKNTYYAVLDNVRKKNDLIGWCKYFLSVLIETAEDGKKTFIQIKELEDRVNVITKQMQKRCANAQTLIAYMYQNPLISVSKAGEILHVSLPTARGLIRAMEEKGLLEQYTKKSHAPIFVFAPYMIIFNSPVVPSVS